MRYSDPRLVDHLASAYVLGTLGAHARRRFERLRGDRADVALAVAQWEARLARLAHSIAPVEPSPRVWRAIEARTRPAATRREGAGGGWLRLTGWGVGGVIVGLGIALSALLVAPSMFMTSEQVALRAGGKLPPSYVGLLTDAEGNGKVLVSSLRRGSVMTVKVIGPLEDAPAGQHLVLWAIPKEGAPFVLGNVPQRGSATATMPDTSEKLLANVGKLMVTVESADAPKAPGPVVLSGNCAKLW